MGCKCAEQAAVYTQVFHGVSSAVTRGNVRSCSITGERYKVWGLWPGSSYLQ